METHLGKTIKALFILNEKYVSTFCLHTQLAESSLGILYNSDRLLSPHALWFWFQILPLFFTPLSIRTQPGSFLQIKQLSSSILYLHNGLTNQPTTQLTKQLITNVNPAHILGFPFYNILPVVINRLFFFIQQDVISILVHSVTTENKHY